MTRIIARAGALCLIAGYVDAIGYTMLGGVFTANMTGNSVLIGIAAARGELGRVGIYALTLLAFFGGALVGSALRRVTLQPALALLAAALILLGAAFIDMPPDRMLVVLALAMGLQGAAVVRFGSVALQTVVVTGTMVRLAEYCIERLLPRQPPHEPGVLELHAIAWFTYALGAALAVVVERLTARPLVLAAVAAFIMTAEVAAASRQR